MIDYTIRFENPVVLGREVLNIFAHIITDENKNTASIELLEYSKGELSSFCKISITTNIKKYYPNLNKKADILAMNHDINDITYKLLNCTLFFNCPTDGTEFDVIDLNFD